MSRIAAIIATAGGVGRLPGAPGTYGSLVGLALAAATPAAAYPVFALATAAIGLWATAKALPAFATKDPSEIVIDEVSGQIIALAPAAGAIGWAEAAIGFVAFRFFDILKPGPVRAAERAPGAWGVMLDDWAAGVAAALCVFGYGALVG